MTNRLAIILAVLIVAAVVADAVVFDGAVVIFLTQKLVDLISYLKFWR